MEDIALYTVKHLAREGLKAATAESCTGGLIAKMITDVSGSSGVFECGIVSYSNDIKHRVLGVKQETLDRYTEVSEQTVIEMAKGAVRISGADIGVSVSGYAGPTADKDEDVGLIWLACVYGDKCITAKIHNRFDSDVRNRNRLAAAEKALSMINEII